MEPVGVFTFFKSYYFEPSGGVHSENTFHLETFSRFYKEHSGVGTLLQRFYVELNGGCTGSTWTRMGGIHS